MGFPTAENRNSTVVQIKRTDIRRPAFKSHIIPNAPGTRAVEEGSVNQ